MLRQTWMMISRLALLFTKAPLLNKVFTLEGWRITHGDKTRNGLWNSVQRENEDALHYA